MDEHKTRTKLSQGLGKLQSGCGYTNSHPDGDQTVLIDQFIHHKLMKGEIER